MSGVPDEVPPPPLISGVEEEQEEEGKTLSLMSFNYFLWAFLGAFQQHPGNRGRALSGSPYSLAGSQGEGGQTPRWEFPCIWVWFMVCCAKGRVYLLTQAEGRFWRKLGSHFTKVEQKAQFKSYVSGSIQLHQHQVNRAWHEEENRGCHQPGSV